MRSPIAVVGLGKAGGSLLASARHAQLSVVAKARRLPRLLHDDRWLAADVLVLAVPDDAIEDVASTLAKSKKANLPGLVVHMSGAKGPSALAALSARGVVVGCFHPLASLDGKSPIPRGTLVAVDASAPAAVQQLTSLAKRFGCKPARVTEANRALYHAGAVVAGNLPVALVSMGVQLLVDAGVPAKLARESLARLLKSQAQNAIDHELARALTGPVARGDDGTLTRHLEALAKRHADIARVYRELSRVLVDDVSTHSTSTRAKLRHALR